MRFLAETSTKTVPSPPAAHSSGMRSVGELLLDALGVGFGRVDFIDGDDDGDGGGLGVIDGLEGLRHDAVVRGDDDDNDVSNLCAAGSHAGEGFVAGGVEEDDLAA